MVQHFRLGRQFLSNIYGFEVEVDWKKKVKMVYHHELFQWNENVRYLNPTEIQFLMDFMTSMGIISYFLPYFKLQQVKMCIIYTHVSL